MNAMTTPPRNPNCRTSGPQPTGTCPTCGREDLRLTKAGRVWNHRHPTETTASGLYRTNCGGGTPTTQEN